MAVPEGYISLGFVGFTDKGEFSPDIVYKKNDVVHKDNAIWKCLVDDTVGIAPVEGGGNWEIFIQSQTKASGITVTDTFGVVGDTGEVVVAQTFLDSLADKVMNQVLKKADLVNNALATIPGQTALDSAMGKNFQNQIDGINSNLTIKYSAFTPSAGIEVFYNNNIYKFGRVACYNFQSSTVYLKSGQVIASVPSGFRPMVATIGIAAQENGELIAYNIDSDGNLIIYGDINNKPIIISGAYIVAE